MPLIVKFIRDLFETKVFCSVVCMAVSAISKYHVVDKDTGIPEGQHSLVAMAKKTFWPKSVDWLNGPISLPHTENSIIK